MPVGTLKGYGGDPRNIEALQSYWEELDLVARVEVLREIMIDKCKSWRTPPPYLRGTAEFQVTRDGRVGVYYREQREIILYVRMPAIKKDIMPAIEEGTPYMDRIDLALEVVMHETAHHIDYMFRMRERKLLKKR